MRVCLGGTFHPFHAGHAALLEAAASRASALFVGVTVGGLAKRERVMASLEERIAAVEHHLDAIGFVGERTVRALDTPEGPAASEDYDVIVVSPETVKGAARINDKRQARGLKALEVVVVPHVLAQDLLPISSTRIAQGDIDAYGQRLTPVRVAVGSENRVKIDAARAEVASILELDADVRGFATASGVPEQPQADETARGARQRATAALAAWPDADYGIGVEAGLVSEPGNDQYYDLQRAYVVDRTGLVTDGWGPAFHYPEWVTKRALAGEMISDILGPVADDPRIGGTTGAIGFLTDGHMDRTALTRIAVLMAFVPRMRRDLYVRS